MKVLINIPDLSLTGGVANHYKGLLPFWKNKVCYNYVGRRKNIPFFILLPFDYVKFIFLCLFGNYDLIVLNPSLAKNALKRDHVFLTIATIINKKTIVFWHGWSADIAKNIYLDSKLFITMFGCASKHIVLSTAFKQDLENWGIKAPIYLSTTKVDDNLLQDFVFEKERIENVKLLFLARLEKEKGIYIALRIFVDLLSKYPNLSFYIAGSGSESRNVVEYVNTNRIKNVHILGNISGSQLINTLKNSTIYILPTFHGEGMPTSVLEAMAFGLPVISRPVGGLNDFFENGKMGYLIESMEPEAYVDKIALLIENQELLDEIILYNHFYAKKHFLASEVARSLELIFQNAV